jgi:hypothetical protein
MEMEKAIAMIAKYRAVPKKLIFYGTAESPASGEELNNLMFYLESLAPEENAIINKPFKMEDLSFSGKDVNFEGYLTHIKKKIISGLAPEFLLGMGADVNRATAHEQLKAFMMSIESYRKLFTSQIEELILKPLITYYNKKGGLQTNQGFKKLSEDVWIDFGKVDFEDEAGKTERLNKLWVSNLITINELRQELGLTKVDNGDEMYYVDWMASKQLQVKPTADMPNVTPPKEPKAGENPQPANIGWQPKQEPGLSGMQLSEEYDPSQTMGFQFRFCNELKPVFYAVKENVINDIQILKEGLKTDAMGDIIDSIPESLKPTIKNLVKEVYNHGWKEASKIGWTSYKAVKDNVLINLENEVFEKISTLNKKQKKEFLQLITEYVDERRNVRAIAPMSEFIDKIAKKFDLMQYEADAIVRSEIIRLHSEGVRDVILASPELSGKYIWKTSKLESMCSRCAPLHNQIFNAKLPVKEDYQKTGRFNPDKESLLPVKSTHCNCMCSIWVVKD